MEERMKESDVVYVFGQNSYGELGDTEDRVYPEIVPFFHDIKVKQVSAGNEHSAILTDCGKVYTFGFNGSGQLGQGNTSSIFVPTEIKVLSDKNVVFLGGANGCEHLIAITKEGKIYTCGYNNYGQLGHGNQTNLSTPTKIENLNDKKVVHASCSYYHSLILTETSKEKEETNVYSVGRNENGQLGQGNETHQCVGKIIPSLSTKKIKVTACGLHHSMFVSADGLVYSCGFNDNGQLGHNDTKSRSLPTLVEAVAHLQFQEVACGYYHTLIRSNDYNIYAFGRNDKGQLGLGDSHPASLVPCQITKFKIKDEDAKEGDSSQIHQMIKIIKIACGCYHSIVLSDSHEIYSFGRGNHGQLGLGNTNECKIPKIVASLKNLKVIGIAGGFYHTVVLVDQTNSKPYFSLAKELSKLLNNPNKSDITFYVQNKAYYAHRCILFARCPKLDKQIDKSGEEIPEEKKKDTKITKKKHYFLKIEEGISYLGFEIFMEYLYTNNIPVFSEKFERNETVETKCLLDLLSLSQIYKTKKLKEFCENELKGVVKIENVALILHVGEERKAVNLRKYCFSYIMKNFGKVIATAEFTQLPKELLSEVLKSASELGATIENSPSNNNDDI